MKYIWILHKDLPSLSLFPEVAERLGLRDGQVADDATYQRALQLNCETGIAKCLRLRSSHERVPHQEETKSPLEP